MKKKRIAIDMDEVLADPLARFIEWYERDNGIKISKEELFKKGQKIYEYVGKPEVRDYLQIRGFFKDLPLMEGSHEVVKWLSTHYEIFIVTAAMEFKTSLEDKYDWLRNYFPFLSWKNFVFCGDKSIILADYLIDDHVHNLETFRGRGILFQASHNIHDTRFTRVKNWQEVQIFFEKELALATTHS